MQLAQLKQCTDCSSMEAMYNKVDCSIYQLMRNKWLSVVYNTESEFDSFQYKTLLRMKRILNNRIYNSSYPSSCYTSQDIIAVASTRLYKANSCPQCYCEDFSNFITTTTTTLLP